MTKLLLKGRFGYYAPRNADERARARRQAALRREKAAAELKWLESHKWCANGCGQPTAFYAGPFASLRFGGCCSEACEQQREARRVE